MAKRPRDLNQLAKLIVDIAAGEAEDTVSPQKKAPESVKGRAGGLKGGRSRATSIPADRLADIARLAATARWKKN
jgi:hypothetical protein